MKRVWTILLVVVLVLSVTAPAIAAQATGGSATTLRLEETEGTVTVKNASGKTVTSRKGMRLYSGYTISTGRNSYAYISLDDTKAVKLDASSAVELMQAGKKLEIMLKSGNVLFNVTAPVKADESLSIRTSTMITGVRGTTGWVKVVDEHTAQFSLLEGALDITRIDPVSGKEEKVPLTGGQTITVVFQGVGQGFDPSLAGQQLDIQKLIDSGLIREDQIVVSGTGMAVETLQEKNVPGFVAVEVAEDPQLQKKIAENSDLVVSKIVEGAKEKLQAEKDASREKEQELLEALGPVTDKTVDSFFGTNYEDVPFDTFIPWQDPGSGSGGVNSGEIPGGSDSGEIPGGSDSGEIPGGSDSGEIPGGSDSGEIPGGI